MNCSCKEWKENIGKVNGPTILQALRQGTKGYEGVPFKFCPWCGEKLNEE